ncbi:DNA topoisomerase IB [Aggregatimonas sangjinii]|uniref:DNA topoisomerase n=1 Tax=Aggregatimonas sangjinii TaxID=2583587 RepID=A0A5B7SXF6_9FLAO|nr:DNA topoisomerase IB [Aggregatimonas sangjinii]QCX01969.1 DNA topoisomerase IB [Aggregatimonas sangjinii]
MEFLELLLKEPEIAIEHLDLTYVNDDELTINRIKKNKAFEYAANGSLLKEEDQLKRIEGLVIPPAWENVRITHLPNGHLQAVGRDTKRRKQYRYHPTWTKVRNQTKFYKMISFGEQLPKIRERVDQDLDQKDWTKSKVLALIIRLMEETHIRIGNEQYAKRNKTYGLSTLRTRHVNTFKDALKFEFKGKKGKQHKITLRNKRLIRLVNRCEEIPGWELFQYYDAKGDKHSVDSGMVNDYLHKISGALFTAKDFRTWSGSIIFFESLMALKTPKTPKQIQKNILRAYDSTAKELGNTRNVCRKYYVHPMLARQYESGNLGEAFDKVDAINDNAPFFSPSEQVVLDLIKAHKPTLTEA